MSNTTDPHPSTDDDLARAAHLRAALRAMPMGKLPITYKALAKQLDLRAPHSIHRLTTALEITMREDVANGVPMIAALVVSRWRGGVPAPGFFVLAAALGRHDGTADETFHRREFEAAVAHWLARKEP
ncbi:MAG TPA: hypothetical protein PJ986_16525 [Gammaproteobacteria bacterium]|nr:hypothetical protein [Gammaproteobacteria bacterium]